MESGESSAPPHGEANDLLARGRAVLIRLKLEAEAARAEARRLELEQLLSYANESGRTESLRQWLSSYEDISLSSLEESATSKSSGQIPQFQPTSRLNPITAPDASTALPASPTEAIQSTPEVKPVAVEALAEDFSWDQLLPQARQNLARRAMVLKTVVDSTSTSTTSEQAAAVSARSTSASQETLDRKTSVVAKDVGQRTTKPTAKVSNNKQASVPITKQALAQAPTKLPLRSSATSPVSHLAEPEQPSKLALPSRLRSVSASLLAHLLLLLVLAFVTFKLPVPPASLTFQSATTTATETFEVSQPLEPTTAELNETTEMPEVSTDLSETFDALTTDLSATLAATQLAPTAVTASAVSSAVAAAQSASSLTAAAAAGGSFFGAQASGNCFCYIIDSSGSMRGGAWEAAKAELARSLDTLTASQRFYIIFFNNQLDLIPSPGELEPAPNPIYATPENVQHAKRWIDTIRIATGAPPNDALTAAIKLEPDAIYLLTDGVTKVDVCAHLQQVNRINDLINGELVKTPIHAIAYYSDKGEQLMRQVAAENQGQFIYVPKPK